MYDAGYLTALDLGSSSFRAVVAGPARDDSIAVWSIASVPAEGMRDGRPTDLPAVAHAVRGLLDEVWDKAQVEGGPVYVAVAGDEIRSLDTRVSMSLENRGVRIQQRHLEVLDQRVRAIDVPFDRVILHSLPVEYALDDRAGLEDPTGLVGTRLSLEAHVVTGSQSMVGAIRQAVAMAEADVSGIVYSGCAAASYLLEPEARERGALMIDIGAGIDPIRALFPGFAAEERFDSRGGEPRDPGSGLGSGDGFQCRRACQTPVGLRPEDAAGAGRARSGDGAGAGNARASGRDLRGPATGDSGTCCAGSPMGCKQTQTGCRSDPDRWRCAAARDRRAGRAGLLRPVRVSTCTRG